MEKEKLSTLNINTSLYHTRLSKKYLNRKPYAPKKPGIIMSFIPGTVVDILVKVGQKVTLGEGIIVLEAMKMKNLVKSPVDGTVKSISVSVGARVPKGKLLLEITC